MKVAITGAMGLIGRALVDNLADSDFSLTCLSRSDMPKKNDGIRWLRGDLNESGVAGELVTDQDVIVHLAHDSTPLTASMGLIKDAQRSLFPSLRLIQAIASSENKPHFIYLSSGGAVYGDTSDDNTKPFSESDACFPVIPYGIQKYTIERYLHNAAQNDVLRATILRASNVYGKLLPSDCMQGLIGTSISRVILGQPLRLIGNSQNVRDYVYIQDVVLALRKTFQLESDFEVFNIGSGVGYSVLEVMNLISKITGSEAAIQVKEIAGSKLLPNWCVLDVSKAHDLLGWQAGISLDEGIASMFETVVSQR